MLQNLLPFGLPAGGDETAVTADGRGEPVRANSSAGRLLRVSPGSPLLTVESVSRRLDVSPNRVNPAANALAEAGVVSQHNVGRERYCLFAAPAVLDLWATEGDPFVSHRLDLCGDVGGRRVCVFHRRRLQPADRRLARRGAHAHHHGPRRLGDGPSVPRDAPGGPRGAFGRRQPRRISRSRSRGAARRSAPGPPSSSRPPRRRRCQPGGPTCAPTRRRNPTGPPPGAPSRDRCPTRRATPAPTAPPAPSPPRYSDAQTTYLLIVVLPWLHSRFQAQEPPTNPVRFMDAEREDREPKREDLRLTLAGRHGWEAIAEVKGYSGGTKTSDSRQIREYRDRYFSEEQRIPDRTWWIANTYRTIDPSNRPTPDSRENESGSSEMSGHWVRDRRGGGPRIGFDTHRFQGDPGGEVCPGFRAVSLLDSGRWCEIEGVLARGQPTARTPKSTTLPGVDF